MLRKTIYRNLLLLGFLGIAIFWTTSNSVVFGQTPPPWQNIYTYNGVLTNTSGTPITENITIRFSLWNSGDFVAATDQESTTKNIKTTASSYGKWVKTQTFTPKSNGFFSINLNVTKDDADTILSYPYIQMEIRKASQADADYEFLDVNGDAGVDTVDRQPVDISFLSIGSVLADKALSFLDFDVSKNFKTGTIVIHDGHAYQAQNAVNAGSFTVSQWRAVGLMQGGFNNTRNYKSGDIIWGSDNKIYRVKTNFTPPAEADITHATVQANLQALGGNQNSGVKYDSTVPYAIGSIITRDGELLVNTTATTGSVSSPETFNQTKWRNWRVNQHSIVADKTALLALPTGNGITNLHINDTVYQTDNETLYRYTSTDTTNDSLADWTVIYDFNRKLDQTEFESRFGAKPYISTATYKKNELVIQKGVLYRANKNIGTTDTNGVITATAGTFNSTDWDILVNINGLLPVGSWNVAGKDPNIPAATTLNQRQYYLVSNGGTTQDPEVITDISASTVWFPGDMLINLDGSHWTRIANTTAYAIKSEAEVSITSLKNDGTELTVGDISNTKVLTPLRALQLLLKNRLASLFQLRDNTDETKKIQFDLSNITTKKTRIISIPDEDITLVGENRIGTRVYSSSETYLKNQLVVKDGVIWRNIVPITTGESFTQSRWTFVSNSNVWTTTTAATTATPFSRHTVNTSGGSFTLNLPASPVNGDTVEIKDGADFSVNSLVLGRNGSTINRKNEDLTIDVKNSTVKLLFTGGTWTVEFDIPLD